MPGDQLYAFTPLCWLLRAPVDLRREDVVVMETTDHRESDDRCAAGERTAVGWNRNPLRYSLVWSSHVEIAELYWLPIGTARHAAETCAASGSSAARQGASSRASRRW
jgi:hypothetical protein